MARLLLIFGLTGCDLHSPALQQDRLTSLGSAQTHATATRINGEIRRRSVTIDGISLSILEAAPALRLSSSTASLRRAAFPPNI